MVTAVLVGAVGGGDGRLSAAALGCDQGGWGDSVDRDVAVEVVVGVDGASQGVADDVLPLAFSCVVEVAA